MQIEEKEKKIVFLKTSDLTLLEKNPRKISKEQMQKLCKSIEEDPDFFINRPCLVNDKNGVKTVYAGNQRVRAARRLKIKSVPCIVDNDLSDDIMKQRIIKDNKTYGEFDFEVLIAEYDTEMLLDAGFSYEDLAVKEVEEIINEDEEKDVLEPGKDEDSITKLGDLYELNNHRIFCGDSTIPDSVARAIDDNTPVLMVTDPPYGVEYDPTWREAVGKGCRAKGIVQNDDKVNWALAWHLFPGSVAYVWHAGKYCSEVQKSLEEAEFKIVSQIIWVKQHFALSRGDYHWQHEPCWYAVKKGHQHKWQGARDQSTVWEIANLNAFGKAAGDSEERTAHSTQKPVECMARPIRNNSEKGQYVYDPFLGSGSTLIACEQLDRVCIGIELSPSYCDIIVNRWKKFMIKSGKSFVIKKNGEVIEESENV